VHLASQLSPSIAAPERAALAVVPRRLAVLVATDDPLSRAGIEAQLREEESIQLVDSATGDTPVSAVVVADAMDSDVATLLRRLRREGVAHSVLVATRLDDAGMLMAVEHGVAGVLRRAEATTRQLVRTLHAVAAGDGALPADLLGRLMDQVGRLQRSVLAPRGLTFTGLTEREVAVLTLLAEGHDTAEVGRRLFYSERTVKNVVHDVTSRFDLRNRTHAVAFAIREGYI
jgi:DNA-binding NarL/FixJ family response regulator